MIPPIYDINPRISIMVNHNQRFFFAESINCVIQNMNNTIATIENNIISIVISVFVIFFFFSFLTLFQHIFIDYSISNCH